MGKSIEAIKNAKEPVVCLTAYTASMAQLISPHCDLLLVGDSLAMVLHGMNGTQGATMEMMILHGQSVMRAQPNSVVIVDMPYGSYETDPVQALESAQRIMDETGCDGVKLEGGEPLAPTVKYLVDNDIPVLAHVGLLPQSATKPSDYKVKGRAQDDARKIIQDAKAVEAAGAFAVVVEAVTEPLAVEITKNIDIPTIGIGASAACDGQILVTEDMVGLNNGHIPKFVEQYAVLHPDIEKAAMDYAAAVKSRQFPSEKHTYQSKPESNNTLPMKKAS